MMKARTSLWASLAIAASVGLAGCGGSSDNDDPTPKPEVTPAAPVVLPLPEGNTIRKSLRDENDAGFSTDISDSITVPAGESTDYSGVRFSCEGSVACTVNFTLDQTDAKATTGGEGSGMAKAVLLSTVGTGAGFSTLRTEVRSRPDAAAGRIGSDNKLTDFGKLASRLGFPHSDERVSAAGVVSATAGDFASRQLKDPTGQEFAEASHDAADSPWTGWTGKAWTGGDETLVRFDNQGEGESFAVKYGNKVGSSDDVTPVTGDASDFWNLVRTTPVAGATGGRAISKNDGNANAVYSLPATFDGVAGTLSCTNSNCNDDAPVNDGGSLRVASSANGNWKFTATDSKAVVTDINADYLAFGWWREAGTGGTFTDFEPVYGGRVPFPDTAIVASDSSSLKGKAVYNGGAAGNYTVGNAGDMDRHGGWFVADAKITATFTDNGESGAPDDTIKGEITNFRGKHEGLLAGWRIEGTLKGDLTHGTFSSVNTTPNTEIGNNENNVTRIGFATLSGNEEAYKAAMAAPGGQAHGGSPWRVGAMGGTFYGDSAAGKLPSSVAGWFHAHSGEGGVAVQGSFAATR